MRRADCKHTEGAQHDCNYVDQRNACMPAAEAHADRCQAKRDAMAKEGEAKGRSSWEWSRDFLDEMDHLANTRYSARRAA